MPLAYIQFIEGRPDRPVDPGWGVEGPETDPPGIWPTPPGGRPPHVGNRPPGTFPPHPGNRPPGSLPEHPSTGPVRPSRPVDPGWGVEEGDGGGGSAGQLPVWPIGPDQGLPPVPGHPLPPIDPPPGTVWPPLPPSVPEGKVIALVAISGIGYRYTVLTVPPPKPDQGLPSEPGRPAQPLPPTPQPKR